MLKPSTAFISNRSGALYHLAFWGAYYLFFVMQYKLILTNYADWQWAVSLSVTIWPDIAATYFFTYLLLPVFLLRKRYLIFILLFLMSAGAFVLLQRFLIIYVSLPIIRPEVVTETEFWKFNPFYTFFNIYSVVAVFTAIKLLKNWFSEQQLRSELEKQNRSSELAMLRSQINPHFLFNTLNNIDTLIHTNQERASDTIIRLSEIMRYMLYDSNTDQVDLEKEIHYIRSYIALQQLRLQNPDIVTFFTEGNYRGKYIAPMLLIPFVENAFKHGMKNTGPDGIEIRLFCADDEIRMEVNNRYDESRQINTDDTPGIGLENIRRRLELIYPGKHKLTINRGSGIFKVELKIFV